MGKVKVVRAWAGVYPDGNIAIGTAWSGLMAIFRTQKDCQEHGFEGIEVKIRPISPKRRKKPSSKGAF